MRKTSIQVSLLVCGILSLASSANAMAQGGIGMALDAPVAVEILRQKNEAESKKDRANQTSKSRLPQPVTPHLHCRQDGDNFLQSQIIRSPNGNEHRYRVTGFVNGKILNETIAIPKTTSKALSLDLGLGHLQMNRAHTRPFAMEGTPDEPTSSSWKDTLRGVKNYSASFVSRSGSAAISFACDESLEAKAMLLALEKTKPSTKPQPKTQAGIVEVVKALETFKKTNSASKGLAALGGGAMTGPARSSAWIHPGNSLKKDDSSGRAIGRSGLPPGEFVNGPAANTLSHAITN